MHMQPNTIKWTAATIQALQYCKGSPCSLQSLSAGHGRIINPSSLLIHSFAPSPPRHPHSLVCPSPPGHPTESGNSSVLAHRIEIHEETQGQPRSVVRGGVYQRTVPDRSPIPSGNQFPFWSLSLKTTHEMMLDRGVLGTGPFGERSSKHNNSKQAARTRSQLR